MKSLRYLILIILSTSANAQENWVFKADSLSYCGYHVEELVYRQNILNQYKPNTADYRTSKILLDIAKMNDYGQKLEHSLHSKKYKAILLDFEKLAPLEKAKVEIEVNSIKAADLSENDKYDAAIQLYEQSLKITKSNKALEASLNLNIAQTYVKQKNYFRAIPYFKFAIAGFEANGMKNHYANALAYNDLGLAYDYANMEKDMIPSMEEGLRIWSNFYSMDAQIVSVAFNDVMYVLIEYGDRRKAADIQKRFEKYMTSYLDPKNKENYKKHIKNDNYNTLSTYYLSSLRYYDFEYNEAKVLYFLNAQEQLFATAPSGWKKKEMSMLLSSYDSAAYAFYMQEKWQKSLEYNNIMEKMSNEPFYKMKAAANRAMLYYYKHDYKTSFIHNQKALDYLELLGFKPSFLTLLTLKAENQAILGNGNGAKKSLKEVFMGQFDKDIPFDKIKLKDYGEVVNSSYINILIHAGLAYKNIYDKNGKTKQDLKVMRNFYNVAADMFKDYYQKGFFNPTLERQLNNIKEGLLYSAMQSPNDKLYLASCINKIEDMSSQHLWKQFLAKYSNNLQLSKAIITKRNELVIEQSYLNQKEEKSAVETTRELSLNKQLETLDAEIIKNYPSYGRYQSSDFKVKILQEKLSKNKLIIKYFVTDSSVYGCTIGAKQLALLYLGKRKQLEAENKQYVNQISKIDFGYLIKSKNLYNSLIKPLQIKPSVSLIVVPENFIAYCPFETLSDSKGISLLNYNVISYANNLKFSQPLEDTKSIAFTTFLTGFAPKYKDGVGITRSENGELLYTGKELQNIASIFRNSTLFLNEKATKFNFLNSLGSSKVHHLAMHSLVDEKDFENSSIIFQNNEKLHFYELYALNFPSEMVVLSACNTGVGEYLNGEGLMSISRALNYAGVKSTVNSLWQVPDKETSELMSYFYEFLDNGLTKDVALVKAKQKFISKNPLKAHPYYWSGFVLNGDVAAVMKSNRIWNLVIIISSIALIVLIYYQISKSRKL